GDDVGQDQRRLGNDAARGPVRLRHRYADWPHAEFSNRRRQRWRHIPSPNLGPRSLAFPLLLLRLQGGDIGEAHGKVLLEFTGLLEQHIRNLDVFLLYHAVLLAKLRLVPLQERVASFGWEAQSQRARL